MNYMRRSLEESLRKRGWMRTTDGETVQPADRLFETIPEEVLHLLNISSSSLNAKDIGDYLGIKHKSVSGAMDKLLLYPNANEYITKEKNRNLTFYSCTLPAGVDVKTAYRMMRYSSAKKREISENTPTQINNNIPIGDLLNLVKSGELELVIRKPK